MGIPVSLEYQFVLLLEIHLVKFPLAILLHLFPVPEVDLPLVEIPLVVVQENFVYLLLVAHLFQFLLLLLDLMGLINHLLLFVLLNF